MPKLAVPVDNAYDAVVPLLKSSVPDFVHSSEYALVADHDDLPGVILAAFARFLIRISNEAAASQALERGIGTIIDLYGAGGPQVREAIRDEFIEMFDGKPDAVRAVQPLLSQPLADEFAKVLG
jgi:hypothetical protein